MGLKNKQTKNKQKILTKYDPVFVNLCGGKNTF